MTIAPVTFDDNPADQLPPPPDASGDGPSDMPFWAPRDVSPGFRDERSRNAMKKCLEKHYPPLLRDAGIGGEVIVWAYVNEEGDVEKTQINKSSTHVAMDEVAVREVRVCPGAEFSPGMYQDRPCRAVGGATDTPSPRGSRGGPSGKLTGSCPCRWVLLDGRPARSG